MYKLSTFGFNDLMTFRTTVRNLLGESADTVAEAADRVVRLFYEEFTDEENKPACALVRFFKTHPYEDLDEELKNVARSSVPEADRIPGLRCLVLMATIGQESAWNSPRDSRGHRVIPLTSERMVEEAPMISQLIKQMGVKILTVLQPDPALLLDLKEKSYNVFHVPRAAGSPFIVAQEEFVIPYGIESVLGFGGMLTSGDLFATIMFSKIPITTETAELFTVIGLNLKLAFIPLARKPLFPESDS